MNQQAQDCFEPITEQMKQAEGVTEELKGRGQMAQRGRMNNIAARSKVICDGGDDLQIIQWPLMQKILNQRPLLK